MWNILEPHLLELIGLALTAILTVGAQALRRWTGIEIEARHREALHAALLSGVRAALEADPSRRGPAALVAIRTAAVAHARQSVPDAIRALNPPGGVLERIADRYATEALDRALPAR